MKTIYPPAVDRFDLAPLPTPRASLAKIVKTCLRQITRPIELRMADDQIADAGRELAGLALLLLLGSTNGNPAAVQECKAEIALVKKRLAELEAWQRSLEREGREW